MSIVLATWGVGPGLRWEVAVSRDHATELQPGNRVRLHLKKKKREKKYTRKCLTSFLLHKNSVVVCCYNNNMINKKITGTKSLL